MGLPKKVKQNVEIKLTEYCENKFPPEYRDKAKVGFKIKGDNVTLFEERPSFMNPAKWTKSEVAQFRYDKRNDEWTLYCLDRNSIWHEYTEVVPTPVLDELLREVDEDPYGIFWG